MPLHRPAVMCAARLRASITALVVAGLAATVLAACATSHHAGTGHVGGEAVTTSISPPAGATVTKVRMFAPFGRGGASTAGVAAHRSGSCFTTSITVAGAGVYRCLAGNAILDPCFVRPGSAHVLACFTAPWSRATELRVRSLPGAALTVHIARPWAIELDGGMRCVVTNGTLTILRGVALGYVCPDGSAGLTASSGKTDHALYRATDGLVRVVRVTVSWRARAR